jgi:hypothetical protein
MNSNRKYQIIVGGNPPQTVYPINDKDVEFTHGRNDEEKIFYERKLKNKLVFGNNQKNNITDYTYFYNYEQSPTLRCETFVINIFKKCDGVFILDWTGEFSLNDAEWDLDNCTVAVKAEPQTLYNCVKKQKGKEVNILDVPNIISTYTSLDYNYEYFYCYALPTFGACTLPGTQTGTWTLAYQDLSRQLTYNCNNYTTPVRVYYREYVITACAGGTPTLPPGSGWALETNNCGFNGTAKYVRVPVSGPFPASKFAFGWWNYITNQQELPPEPSFKSVLVTNTPQSENLFYNQSAVVYPFGGTPYPTITYHLEVLYNPNSSYVWSLNPGSPITAIVSGTTNVCDITPNSNISGTIQVLLTETHGNGYVSTKVFNVPQIVSPTAGISQTISATIIGPTIVCPSQQNLLFVCTDVPTVSTGAVSITWTASGGATLASANGNRSILINAPASGTFTVTAFWQIAVGGAPPYTITCQTMHSVTVQEIPVSPPLIAISEVYPSEPNMLFLMLKRSGATYAGYHNMTSLGAIPVYPTYAVYQAASPATLGSHCFLFKETVNCACNYIELIPTQNDGTVGKLPAFYWCPDSSSNNVNITYGRNRLFKEVVEYVVSQLGCNINGVVSDFFEWNPPGNTPGYSTGINYVTGLPNKLKDLLIAQKSDIISYNSSNPATSGLITFEKLEKIWLYMFNAYWFIDSSNRLRVEHVSYFNRTVAYNANDTVNGPFNVAKNKYTYNKSKMPKFEHFEFSERMFTDFIGADIYYDSQCVDQDSTSNKKERNLDFLTSDLYALFIDPASANKVGFVLIANNVVGGVYSVATEVGALSGSVIANGHLSWANLHVHYHKHNRVLLQGYMNTALTNFISAAPTKIQKDIVIKICCGDTIDPLLQLYKTQLGNGIMDEAEESTGKIKINLLHS